MNRKNLLITLALFAFTPSAMAADCVAEQRNGKFTESSTNPASCYFSGNLSGQWEWRFADGTVSKGNYVNGERQGKWEFRKADGAVFTGNTVDDKRQGKWEYRTADGEVTILNFINDELQN